MLSFLKPTKANVAGTALLLVANWAGGFAARAMMPLLMAMNSGGDAGADAVQQIGRRGAFGGAGGMPSSGAEGMQFSGFGNYGLLSGALNLVLLALLFYVVVSFVVEKIAKDSETKA